MGLEYGSLDQLRTTHPAWRLLRSDHAPLVASFLQRTFIEPNIRTISQADLAEALEDQLYALRETYGQEIFPRSALEYLNDWADNAKGWLRKFYPEGSDEPHFDLSPASEKAIGWLSSLSERTFVGTESRLLTLFDLLRQMSEGTEADPVARKNELLRKRAEIDAEIERIEDGDIRLLDDTAVKDRFQQFLQLARELLADFREVEYNFRTLDREVRERIALWEGAKGDLLEEVMGRRDTIAESDQGRSFRAFWDFLMSRSRQEELTGLLESILALPPVRDMAPDQRLRRIHYDWLEAGEHTQRTVARLSQQLRRFLDDQAWLENRRIMDILHSIEAKALALRERQPAGGFMEVAEASASVNLPMERPLFSPPLQTKIVDVSLEMGQADLDEISIHAHAVVDKAVLSRNIRKALQEQDHISLGRLLERYPLHHGLAELLAYLQLASGAIEAAVDEDIVEEVEWQLDDGSWRRARLPKVIFIRKRQ